MALRVVCTIENITEGFGDTDPDLFFDVTQADDSGAAPGYLTIGTSEETYSFPEFVHGKWTKIKNLGPGVLQVGIATGSYFMVLEQGESNIIAFDSSVTDIYLIATVDTKIQIRAYEA